MSKNNKRFFLVMGICIVTGIVIVLLIAALYVKSALEADYRERNYCTICHQHEKMVDKSYCYYCFEKAKLEEWEKERDGSSSKTSTADPHKNASSSTSSKSDTGSKTTSSSKITTSSSSKTTSGSSSKKEYNTLNYDPDDYDDPDDYAEDAWDEDFDDYDDAYDYWEDW